MLALVPVALAAPTAATVGQQVPSDTHRPAFDLPEQDRTSQPSAEIVNGVREQNFGAAVALTFPRMGIFCTGSMITPRAVLTAAHCVNEQGITPELVSQFGSVTWGTDSDNPSQSARIVAAHPHPRYSLGGNGAPTHDVAVLEIEPVEATQTVWFNTEPLTEADIGQSFTVVGFGRTEAGQSGDKRSAVISLDALADEFLLSDSSNNAARASICSGDSGGPMYGEVGEGRYLQFGIHSWGEQGCQGVAASTDTAEYATFILNQVEQIHGSQDMCENRGANNDGVCDPECSADVVCAAIELGTHPASKGGCQTGAPAPVWFGGLALLGLARRRR